MVDQIDEEVKTVEEVPEGEEPPKPDIYGQHSQIIKKAECLQRKDKLNQLAKEIEEVAEDLAPASI